MVESQIRSKLSRALGGALILAGVAVFAIRLQHAGAYAVPGGGNLLAGLLALLLGSWLLSGFSSPHPISRALRWAVVAMSPVVLFFSLYATLAEMEEVVTLRAIDSQGRPAQLRLWIVDHNGASWVRMPRSKADEHDLTEIRVEILRDGVDRCFKVSRQDDRDLKIEINRLAYEKYRVMQLATAIGIFSSDQDPNQVVLRLDPCPATNDGGD
jgi:hypothetical protein